MTDGLINHDTESESLLPANLCHLEPIEAALDLAPAEQASESNIEPAADTNADGSPDSWRAEVAARLQRYRTRRKPRSPRYPSLLLPFDAPDSRSRSLSTLASMGTGSSAFAIARDAAEDDEQISAHDLREPESAAEIDAKTAREPAFDSYAEPALDLSANVIEFPRSAAIPVFHASELAEPVFDRPRIVEAPEILPPPPALGGMLIEPAYKEPAQRRVDLLAATTLPTASIARRMLAALVDGLVLIAALAGFIAIFVRLNPERAPLPLLAGALATVALLLWMAYEALFVVYTGSTPGLRAAGLRLAAFDGSAPNRRSRVWRVLTSFLSAFSVGLGYVWCVLDQDGLCWHDRITRTHIAPRAQ